MRFSSTIGRAVVALAAAITLAAGLSVSAEAAAVKAAPVAPAGVRIAIHPGLHGFDSLAVENPTQINCLRSAGYSFDMVNTNDLTNSEYNAAAAAGMNVVLFQGYYQPYWKSSGYGTSQGKKAVAAAAKMKYPTGAMIFLNLEATNNSTPAVMRWWVTHWVAAVRAGHYLAGVYVGAKPGLSTATLQAITGLNVFWRSASTSGVPVMTRGYAVTQPASLFNKKVCTTVIDGDIAGKDVHGTWLTGASFPRR